MYNSPFFILGNPRSGTSLFRLMLNTHDKMVVPPECGYIEWLYMKYKIWDASKINDFVEDVFQTRKFETWQMKKMDVLAKMDSENIDSYQKASSYIHKLYKTNNIEKIRAWGDKNNYYIDLIPKLKTIYPSCKIIHLVRDGRDVATSYLEMNKIRSLSEYKPQLPQNIESIAKEWVSNNKKIAKYDVQGSSYLNVRYEDLILKTESTLKQVCGFLGLHFDEKMLDYYKAGKKEPKELLAWKKKTQEVPDASRIGKYKSILTNHQISSFESLSKEELIKYKYKC